MIEDTRPPEGVHDPLDMHQYRIEKLPKREKSKLERWLAIFVASILLWLTDAIPNYLTSLLVIILAGETWFRVVGITPNGVF